MIHRNRGITENGVSTEAELEIGSGTGFNRALTLKREDSSHGSFRLDNLTGSFKAFGLTLKTQAKQLSPGLVECQLKLSVIKVTECGNLHE